MNAPIYDFLGKYAAADMLRCHMPGHKGRAGDNSLSALFPLDITEISGADSLFEAEGIIAESERNAAALYGSKASVYSAGGSTLCIQAMLFLMKQERRRIIAVRNVHRAFLNAAALLGLDVEWLYPVCSGGILSGEIDLCEAEKLLAGSPEPVCLYVTSPDYTGKMADIRGLSAICRRYGARLLVDNAHGAHLAFFEENLHPIALGADLCCDSAHKMLPALTGAALLHTSREEYAHKLKQAMSLFGSTSPSYLIMASLDLCNRYIAEHIRRDIAENFLRLAELRRSFSDRIVFAESEPFHITVKASESGFSGNELARLLRTEGAECEYADEELLVLLMSPVCRQEDFTRLSAALKGALGKASRLKERRFMPALVPAKQVMSIREAAFAPSEEISADSAAGRICASVKVPCPPAIPIAVSGELIGKEHTELFKAYGIRSVLVVR